MIEVSEPEPKPEELEPEEAKKGKKKKTYEEIIRDFLQDELVS